MNHRGWFRRLRTNEGLQQPDEQVVRCRGSGVLGRMSRLWRRGSVPERRSDKQDVSSHQRLDRLSHGLF